MTLETLNYKNWMLSIGIGLLSIITLQAQNPHGEGGNKGDRDKIEAMKIGFITKALDLSQEEAQQFWPVYNQFEAERNVLHKEKRAHHKGMKEGFDEMSDKEVETAIEAQFDLEQRDLDLKKKYHQKLKEVLPLKKVALLYKAEKDFRMKVLKTWQDRKGSNPGGPHGH